MSKSKFVRGNTLFKGKLKVTDDELEQKSILEATKRVYVFNTSAKDMFTVIFAGEKQEELFGDPNLARNATILKTENNIDEKSSLGDIVLNSKQSILLPFCSDRKSNMHE